LIIHQTAPYARSSREDGAVGHHRPFFQRPGGTGSRGSAKAWSDGPNATGPLVAAKGDPDPGRGGADGAHHRAPQPSRLRASCCATNRGITCHGQPGIALPPAVEAARMIAIVPGPSSVNEMVRQHQMCPCGELRLPATASGRRRSEGETVMDPPVRRVQTRMRRPHRRIPTRDLP
jgi:hypothetical protein